MVLPPKQQGNPESLLSRGEKLTEEETRWKKNLKDIFNMLDKSGDGAISLPEMRSELCSLPDSIIDEEVLAGIERQFKFLDLNLNGYVTFHEFYSAITASMNCNHKTLQKEQEVADFGSELFTLMALYQRHKLKEQEKPNMYEIEGEPLKAYGRIKRAQNVSLLSLDLMRETRKSEDKNLEFLEKH